MAFGDMGIQCVSQDLELFDTLFLSFFYNGDLGIGNWAQCAGASGYKGSGFPRVFGDELMAGWMLSFLLSLCALSYVLGVSELQ
jgi:hypothetical protein